MNVMAHQLQTSHEQENTWGQSEDVEQGREHCTLNTYIAMVLALSLQPVLFSISFAAFLSPPSHPFSCSYLEIGQVTWTQGPVGGRKVPANTLTVRPRALDGQEGRGAKGYQSTHPASFFSPIFLRRCWSTLETPTVIFVRSGVAHVPIGSQLVFGLRSRCIEIHGVSFLDILRRTRTHSIHICMCTREALGLGFRVYAFVLYAYQRVPRGRPAS